MAQTYKFDMDMTCEGCVNSAKKVLSKLENIEDVQASYETKTVCVKTNLSHDVVLKTLQKTGKTVTYVGTV